MFSKNSKRPNVLVVHVSCPELPTYFKTSLVKILWSILCLLWVTVTHCLIFFRCEWKAKLIIRRVLWSCQQVVRVVIPSRDLHGVNWILWISSQSVSHTGSIRDGRMFYNCSSVTLSSSCPIQIFFQFICACGFYFVVILLMLLFIMFKKMLNVYQDY